MIYPQIWNTSDNKNAIRETPKVNLFLSGKIANDDKINLEIKYSGKAKHPAILAALPIKVTEKSDIPKYGNTSDTSATTIMNIIIKEAIERDLVILE